MVDVLPRVGGYPVHAAKIARAGVEILTGHTVKEVAGDGLVEEATVWRGRRALPGRARQRARRSAVDCVAVAVGLTPMAELAWLAGCDMLYVPELGGHVPVARRTHGDERAGRVRGRGRGGRRGGLQRHGGGPRRRRLGGAAAGRRG